MPDLTAPARISSLSVAQQLATELARPDSLAPLPEVAMRAMRLADDPNANSSDLVKVVSCDAALSARVLKIVNSAFYGARAPVTSISTAVSVLGFGAIKNIAIAASLTRTFRGVRELPSFEPRSLWAHSVAVATVARLIAVRCRKMDPSDAFLAGLMHDIGVIVELQLSRDQFLDTVNMAANDAALSFRDAELHFFGATHEAYGEALAIAWHFPVGIRQACGFHHRPHESLADSRLITSIVHLADVMAAQAGVGYCRTVETQRVDADIAAWVGLREGDVNEILTTLPLHLAEVLPLLEAA